MEINGITIPDEGSTKQYIPDPIGGWLYEVTTYVSVKQKRLSEVQEAVTEAHAKIAEAQAVIDALMPQLDVLQVDKIEQTPEEALRQDAGSPQ